MAENKGARVSVEIGADVDKLKTGINEAKNLVEKGTKDLQDSADKNKVKVNVDVENFGKKADKSLKDLQQHIKNTKFEMPELNLDKGMNSYISKLKQQIALIKKETARDISSLGSNPDNAKIDELRTKELEKQLSVLKAIKLAQENIYNGNAHKLGKDNTQTIKAKIDLANIETQINQVKNKLGNIKAEVKTDAVQINNEASKIEKELENKLRNVKAQIIIDQSKAKTVVDSLKAEINGLNSIVEINKKNVANAQKEYDRLKGQSDEKAARSAERLAKALQDLKASEEKLKTTQDKLSNATINNASKIEQAQSAYSNFKKQISEYNPFSKFISGVSKTASVLAGLAATLATLGGAIALVDKAVSSGEATYQNMGKLNTDSKDTGYLTKELKLGGASIDEFGKFYEKMVNQFAKAEWSEKDKAQTAMMKKWDVDIYKDDGTLKNGKEFFDSLAVAMAKAKEVNLGDEFTAEVLQGNQWLETTLEEVEKFQEVISKVPSTGLADPEAAHQAYIEFEALKMTTGQLANIVGQALIPVFNELVPDIQKFAAELVTLIKNNKEPIKEVVKLLMGLVDAFAKVVVGLGKMKQAFDEYGPLGVIGSILEGLAIGLAKLNPFSFSNNDNKQNINDDSINEKGQEFLNTLSEKFDEMIDFFLKPFDIMQEKTGELADILMQPFDILEETVNNVCDSIANGFTDITDYLYENSDTVKSIIDNISPIFNSIVEWIESVINTCCEACDKLIDWIADGIKSVSDGLYSGIKSIVDTLTDWANSIIALFGKEKIKAPEVSKPEEIKPKKPSNFKSEQEKQDFINRARSTKGSDSDTSSKKKTKASDYEKEQQKLEKDQLNELKSLRSEQKSLLQDLKSQLRDEIEKNGYADPQTLAFYNKLINEFIDTDNLIREAENKLSSNASDTAKAINELRQIREQRDTDKFISELKNLSASKDDNKEKGYKNSLGQTILPPKIIDVLDSLNNKAEISNLHDLQNTQQNNLAQAKHYTIEKTTIEKSPFSMENIFKADREYEKRYYALEPFIAELNRLESAIKETSNKIIATKNRIDSELKAAELNKLNEDLTELERRKDNTQKQIDSILTKTLKKEDIPESSGEQTTKKSKEETKTSTLYKNLADIPHDFEPVNYYKELEQYTADALKKFKEEWAEVTAEVGELLNKEGLFLSPEDIKKIYDNKLNPVNDKYEKSMNNAMKDVYNMEPESEQAELDKIIQDRIDRLKDSLNPASQTVNNSPTINYNPQITVDFSNSINGDNVIDTAKDKLDSVVSKAQNDFTTQINKINDSFDNNSFAG